MNTKLWWGWSLNENILYNAPQATIVEVYAFLYIYIYVCVCVRLLEGSHKSVLKSVEEELRLLVETSLTKTKPPVEKWSKYELIEANNSKGINVSFMAVWKEEFKRISMSETIKGARVVLEITYERPKTAGN